jgi:hypothetical protein
MPRLVMKSQDFFTLRDRQVRLLIRDIAEDVRGLQIRPHRHALGHIISVSDSFSSDASPADHLFRTTSEQLYGQYYEIWRPDSAGKIYHMYQNYFHLYALQSKSERDQLFCLHSEPEEPFQPIIHRVKSTPHIHVKVKEARLAPMSSAHLPVCYSTTEAVLKSIQAFDTTFTEALRVIRHEVIDRFV